MRTLKNIAAVACVTALAVPAGVAAKGPSGDHGKSGDQHGQNQKPKTPHVNKRCKKQPKVGFVLSGTLDPSSTAENIVVVVTRTNKHSKPFVTDGKYTVPAGSKIKYEGANPFTTQGADLTKYRVKVIGKVIKYKKRCDSSNAPAPTVKKVTVKAPETTSDDQKPETETQHS